MSAVAIPDEAAYYAAMTNCLDRYEPMARAAGRQDVLAFIGQFRDAIVGRLPVYKLNRWLGYIQGVLIEIGCTNVLAEREWSRPLFRPLDYPSDRSTRPAEPAAPVAEAGDGELVFRFPTINQVLKEMLDVATSQEEGAGGDFEDWDIDHRSQIDLWQAGIAVALEAERARADAAEQRAADALARAEKAAEDERDRLYAEAKGMEGVDSSIAAGWLRYLGPAMLPADRANLRASREAQPATDGGEA